MCGKDGSIVFTSMRDGDIDLYRMDADGENVRRLTHDARLRRRRVLQRRLHEHRLARVAAQAGPRARRLPSAARAEPGAPDASSSSTSPTPTAASATQITYLDAASFAPCLARRGGKRMIFSSNYGDPRGPRVRPVGDRRRRHAPGADHVRARLRRLSDVLARRQAPGVLVEPRDAAGRARHQRFPGRLESTARSTPVVERAAPIACSPTSAGWPTPRARAAASAPPGLDAAGAYIEERFRALGLEPAGDAGGYRQSFAVRTRHHRRAGDRAAHERRRRRARCVRPAGFSASGKAAGKLVLAGYGLRDPGDHIDDYAGLDVKGKIVVVRRFVPDHRRVRHARAPAAAGDSARRRGSRANAARVPW